MDESAQKLALKRVGRAFSVCRLADAAKVDLTGEFVFFAKTDEELSLVCETGREPAGALDVEPGWRALRIEGVLDFGMVGVLAGIAGALAKREIPIFVVSTFNTDYVLVKEAALEDALACLSAEGYTIMA